MRSSCAREEFTQEISRRATKTGDEMRRLMVTLHRASGSLGFNIIGGRCTGSEDAGYGNDGIYVSKIVENGPAEKGGLQLHDKIIKVNENNLSLATHDEAVEAFCTAKDPVEIEVQRRITSFQTLSSPQTHSRGVDTSTQTDITLQHIESMTKLTSSLMPSAMTMLGQHKHLLPTQTRLGNYGSFYPPGVIKSLSKELEYEVDLQKTSTQGLAVSYKTDDEEDSGIYVSEMNPEKVTAKDGRLRAGHHLIKEHEDDEGSTDTATVLSVPQEKDSGVGRTDESTHNDESSEQENPAEENPDRSLSEIPASICNHSPNTSHDKHGHFSSNFGDIPEHHSFHEVLEKEAGPFGIPGERGTLNSYSDDQEIRMLNEELRNIELECLGIIRAHRLQQEAREKQPRCSDVQQSCSRNPIVPELLKQKNFSGDSHISESFPSPSLDIKLSSDFSQSQRTKDGRGAEVPRHKPIPASNTQALSTILEMSPMKTHTPSGVPKISRQTEDKFPATHIPVHARRCQNYMQVVQQKLAAEYGHSEAGPVSPLGNSKPQWKVKVGSDGVRYVTGRQSRVHLLRERALRLREERRGATTDDDAASEMKLGRHWSKEERKRHVRERHRRVKPSGRQDWEEKEEARPDVKEPDIVQFSHRKMMKKRSKKIFDSWMTIQELLAHGVKAPDGTKLYSPLLSVTTV